MANASQQHHPNTPPPLLTRIRHIILIDPSADRLRAIVVEVVMQLSVSGAEFQILQEERVVVEGEGVEDVEVCLKDAV